MKINFKKIGTSLVALMLLASVAFAASGNYIVNTNSANLLLRSGPGTNYPVVKVLREGGNSFTIVDEKNGFGLLKSGIGWIMLQHTERVI